MQTLALLIETPQNIDLVIDRGLVKIVAPLMLDSASSVRNAAAGTLRNLSALKLDICDSLMEQDIMTPLICYFHEVNSKISCIYEAHLYALFWYIIRFNTVLSLIK